MKYIIQILDCENGNVIISHNLVLAKIEDVISKSQIEINFIDWEGLLTVKNLFIDRLNEIEKNKKRIEYEELLFIVSAMHQIIDCEIRFIMEEDRFLILRCVDTSFWEIETNNEIIINKVKGRFNKVNLKEIPYEE